MHALREFGLAVVLAAYRSVKPGEKPLYNFFHDIVYIISWGVVKVKGQMGCDSHFRTTEWYGVGMPFRNPRLPFHQSLCNPEPRASEGHPYTSD